MIYALLAILAYQSVKLLLKGRLVNTLGINLSDPAYDSGAESAPYMLTTTASKSVLSGLRDGNGSNVTDLVIDQGSNSDGEWIRYATGLQICTRFYTYVDDAGYSQIQSTGLYEANNHVPEAPCPQNFDQFFYHSTLITRRTGSGWGAPAFTCVPDVGFTFNMFPEAFLVLDRSTGAGARTWQAFSISIGTFL